MNKFKYIYFVVSILFTSGCSLTRNLPDSQFILYDIEINGVENSDLDAIKNLVQQKPNTRIPLFNFSPGVFFYQFGLLSYDKEKLLAKKESWEKERKELQTRMDQSDNRKLVRRYNEVVSNLATLEKKITYGNWFMRTGNPRVVYDTAITAESVRQIEFYLKNNGFFDATTDVSVEKKKKKAIVTYLVEEKSPYIIDSVSVQTADSTILEEFNTRSEQSFLNSGNRYAKNDLSRERQRVEDILKDQGYYMFSKSYVEFNVFKDTIAKTVAIEKFIRLPASGKSHPIYTIDSISVTISSPSEAIRDEEINRSFDDVHYKMYRDRYAERIINSRIFLHKGDLYNRNDVIETQRQLANLDIFRIINVSFDTLGNSLVTKIFTRPNQKFQITNQLGASVTEQLPGPFFSHSLRNRNLFRGLEIFEFNFRAGLEGVASATTEGGVYRSRELSASGSVIFPQFLIPFNFGTLEKFGRYNPRTRALLGYSYVNRPEYIRDALNTILAYTWATRNLRQQFSVNLLDANLIRSSLDPLFQERLEELQSQGNNLINSFLPSFVSSISGQVIINFNQYGLYQKNQASLWRIFVESGGTTLNLLNPSQTENRSLNYFQFLKFQSDFRRYLPINNRSTLAYRINIGLAKPYGISGGVLPYEKYFFAGGSTSIRAWQPRRLGPGSFTPDLREDGTFDYRFEQPGEILLEAMFEYRRKLFGYFDGAVFVDAGNTWNFEVDPSREGTEFRVDRFYKELAVGTGVGLRMDFEFLVLRLDMGIKAYDPARPEGERFILDNITLEKPLGERGQQVFNIGIGYPF